MKPAPFDYVKPSTLDEALGLFAEHGDDASVLAGGQSLVATLNMRLSSPAILIDINAIDELKQVSVEAGRLRIGALTRHVEIEGSAEIVAAAPLIAEAVRHIAHPAIRNRGTIGGSIALADPAAEYPACAVALNAEIEIAGVAGRRKVAAADFFKQLYETDLSAGEIVTAIEIPVQQETQRSGFAELARRHGDYAMAGLAAQATTDGTTLSAVSLTYFAVGGTPVRAAAAAAAIEGKPIDTETIAAAQSALDDDLDPFDDVNCSAAMKRHLAKELTAQVLHQLANGAADGR